MEVKSNFTDKANATICGKIEKESLNKKIDELAKKTAKTIKMDGFRPGKAPVLVVKQRYEKELENEARTEFFRDMIDQSLKNLDKKPDDMLGEPQIKKFDENGDVEIEISFRPQINLEGFESLIPEFKEPKATKKEIKEEIDKFLKLLAPLEKVEKDTLESGDFAKFDFEGFVDGKNFDGGKASDYVLEIGSKQFIPGFEDGMLGLKVGEEKDIKVTFPADYQAPNLAGKDAIFKVKLHEIQAKKISEDLDDETLKKMMPGEKNPSKEKLEERIKEQVEADKFQKMLNEELKPKFADALVEKYKFDLPKNIIEQEIDVQFRNNWRNFSQEEIKSFREDKDALIKQRESYREEAKKSVALTFIIDAISKLKNIVVSDQEMIQTIYLEAYRYGMDPKKHLDEYRKNGLLPAIKMSMIEDKVFSEIFKKSEKGK